MPCRKKLVNSSIVAAVIGLTGALCALGSGPASASVTGSATAAGARPVHVAPIKVSAKSGTGLELRAVRVPVNSIPAAQRKGLVRSGLAESASDITVYELLNDASGKCLDASTSSSKAGENGDPVQLYSCFNNDVSDANQWWLPEQVSGVWGVLVNYEYGLCLNATDAGGLTNGSKVQLWNCGVDTANEYWDWSDFYDYVSEGYAYPLFLDVGTYDLNAEQDSHGSPSDNGDPIQVWEYLTGSNTSNEYWVYRAS